MSFVHLHTHSEYSLLDGLTRIQDLVGKCAATGMPAVAVTDHGNMFGVMRLLDACEAHGGAVKPIFGCEVYVAPRSRFDRKPDQAVQDGMEDCVDPSGQRDSGYHLVLLAKDARGFTNLSRIVTKGYTEGFYYKPKVDKDLLRQHPEGLICLSACLGGEVQARLLHGSFGSAERAAMEYREIFGDDYYLEIQDQGLPEEARIIPRQFELSKKTGVPLVLTNDSHYLDHSDADLHDTLLCIGTKKQKRDERRMRFRGDRFYAKTPAEMAALFPDRPDLMERTLEIASKVDVYPITRDSVTPNFPVPSGFDLDGYFLHVSRECFEDRLRDCRPLWAKGPPPRPEADYRARLEAELDVILKMGFSGYFLTVWDFIARAREMGVPVGPGRGSAAGSLVAWALRITDMDPMQHGLLFERFLNPERKEMPDIDIDFCRDGRQRVIDYVTEKYGQDRVCNIVTINKMKAKAVMKDVARVFDKDFAWSNELTKLVPAEIGITIGQALEQSSKLRERYEREPDVREILDVSMRLEGLARNSGVHAAGIIIAPDELTKFAPLCKDKDDKVMLQYTKKDAERVGLLKIDFLGLETLTQIEKVQGYIKKGRGRPADLASPSVLEDANTFRLFCAGDTDGVFQFESSGMRQHLRQLQPDRFEDLVALNALYRPATLRAGVVDNYINRRHGREPVKYPIKELEPILEPTYGVIVYQEQVMQIAQAIAGFSLGEADMLRRAIGGKNAEKMKREKAGFVERGAARGFDRRKVAEVFDFIEHFAGYGFNKSHSAAYARVAFETAYLKANHRTEFMAGLLSVKSLRTDDVAKYIANCRAQGIEVLGPDINESDTDFTITKDGRIRFGLAAIKGLGGVALAAILAARSREGGFKDVFHAIKATDLRHANKKAWESLVKAGAFDGLEPNRAAILNGLPNALECGGDGGGGPGMASLFDEAEMASLGDAWSVPEGVPPWGRGERLRNEHEVLGLYVSGHPLEEYAEAIKVHTAGSIARLKERAAEGRLGDRDEVSVAATVAHVSVKKSKSQEQYAILSLEDMTDKMEGLLLASSYDPSAKQKTRPFESYRHLAVADGLLMATGEIRVETIEGQDGDEAGEQVQVKLFVRRLEPLSDYQGRGLTGALVELPPGEYPDGLPAFLERSRGPLPLTLEYRTKDGAVARVSAGPGHGLAFDPELAERLRAETGCALRWTH